ncbi:MAG: nitroreductase family deazaflavin-dependent oxidoreductase [Thaumarchaeota archaeon]|nr:nitroreductase family deazaflavin-dependent oxidoreductase [Nitrososphaerota archaeon]
MNRQIEKKALKIPRYVPLLNPLIKTMLRLGAPVGPMTLLTVRGRKSGKSFTTPVGVMELDGHRYVIGTFGNVNWVRNLRVAREAKIGKGRHRKLVRAQELPVDKAADVFQRVFAPYLSSKVMSSFLKMGYDLNKESTSADYLKEAQRHPAFEVFQ